MAGDFAFRVDSVCLSRHDAVVRSEQRFWPRLDPQGASRQGPGRSRRSSPPRTRPPGRLPGAGGSTGRTAPGLLTQGSEPHRIGVRGRRRAPSRREAGGRPPPRVRGGPSENLFLDGSAGSSRNCPDPDGESEQRRIETRRRRAPPGDSGPRIADKAIRGPGAGPGSAPVSDGRIVLREVRPVASHSKPREVDRVPIREAARGFVAPTGTCTAPTGTCTLNRFAVAKRLRGR